MQRTPLAAPKRIPSATRPIERPPYREFLDRVQGTLPDNIGVTELDTLNSALRFLFERLREARRLFEQEGDDGRAGAFTALAASWMFIVLFRTPYSEGLQVPILRLQDALAMLEENSVLPILKPVPRIGRPASSHVHASLKGQAAGTVQLLVHTGMARSDAHRLVAKKLTRLGVRPERRSLIVTATTVRNWCAESQAT